MIDRRFYKRLNLAESENSGIREGLTTCSSPFCDVQFEQTGIMRLERASSVLPSVGRTRGF
jgi:hypothetical protein